MCLLLNGISALLHCQKLISQELNYVIQYVEKYCNNLMENLLN